MTTSAGRQERGTRTIAITGSSGLIGSALVRAIEAQGDRVRRLRRGELPQGALDGVDAVVNLAGENIFQRWTAAARQRIRESRVRTTGPLAEMIASMPVKPRVLLSASAVGIYGNRGDEVLDEASPLGDDFLASVCKEWEAATRTARDAGVRVVHLRTGIVLAKEGGALAKMLLPFRFGVGGPLGNGAQWMSWIAREDHVAAMLFLIDAHTASGPVNLVAPEPERNSEFSKTLGRVMHRPSVIRVPKFALKLALGEMAEQTALASQRVTPRRLTELGYEFRHPNLESALRAVLD